MTPLTATFQTVGLAIVGRQLTDHMFGAEIGEIQKAFNIRNSRRHDGQAVGPAILIIEAVDLFKAALHDHVLASRLRYQSGGRVAPRSGSRSPPEPSPKSDCRAVHCRFGVSTWPGTFGHRQVGPAPNPRPSSRPGRENPRRPGRRRGRRQLRRWLMPATRRAYSCLNSPFLK